jgi:hypothetical protein
MRSSAWLWLCAVLGCGGKIVEAAPIPETFEKPAAPEAPGTGDAEHELGPGAPAGGRAAPANVTPLDACEVLCERDARCDTTLPALPARAGETGDCRTRCDDRLAEKCGIDEWLLCFASKIERSTCAPLPDECRPAFCAWASCAKQPVSNCE